MNQLKFQNQVHNKAARLALLPLVAILICSYKSYKTQNSQTLRPPSTKITPSLPIWEKDLRVAQQTTGDSRNLGHVLKDVRLWNNNFINEKFEIFVQIDQSYKKKSKNAIKEALKSIQKRSKVIRFKTSSSPPSNDIPYIHIQKTQEGCWSWIGRTSGANEGQVLSLDETNSCMNPGTIQHEILHALGLLHEHTRSDRDSYVKVNWDNIKENGKKNYWKDENGISLGTDYDLNSVMHYSETTYAKDGKKTMKAKVSSYGLNLDRQLACPNSDVPRCLPYFFSS